MLFKDIARVIGYYLYIFAAFMVLPLLFAIYDEFYLGQELLYEPLSALAFIKALLITMGAAALFSLFGKGSKGTLFRREAVAAVAFIWIITPFFAGMPFYFSGTLTNPYQAYFEAASGLTSTGATVMDAKQYDSSGKEIPIVVSTGGLEKEEYRFYGTITPIRDKATGAILYEGLEAVSRPILFWRSFIQWLGGLGVVVLFVAILPALGVGGKVLIQSEGSGPIKDSLTPRAKEAAGYLWKIYLALSAVQIPILLLVNPEMPLFDAVTLALTTVSTGGFSIHTQGISYYKSPATEWVLICFMILGAINFSLYFYLLRGKLYRLLDSELFLFIAILLGTCAFASWSLHETPHFSFNGEPLGIYNSSEAIRQGTFQIVSSITSSGFFSTDYDYWPYEVQTLLLIAMFIGGMSGSTAGGLKIIRQNILFKLAKQRIESIFHPEAIRSIHVGGAEIDNKRAINVFCFFFFLIVFSLFGTWLYIMDSVDPETSLGIVGCMINNSGLAFRVAGPSHSFAFLSNFSINLSSFLMILGRLEFYTILVLFVPGFWQEDW